MDELPPVAHDRMAHALFLLRQRPTPPRGAPSVIAWGVVGLLLVGTGIMVSFLPRSGGAVAQGLPVGLIIGGVLISLLTGIMWLASAIRRLRAARHSTQVTAEVLEHDRRGLLRERALASTADGVFITDPWQPDHPVVYCNEAFERLTGYTSAEVIGRNSRFLYDQDQDQEGLKELRAAIQEQRACRVLLKTYRKDGTMFWNELSVSPVLDEHGQLVAYIGIQHDVTTLKTAEEALEQREQVMHSILEDLSTSKKRVEQQAAALQTANQQLKDLSALKDEFVSKVSHELRTPLTAIKEGISLMLDEALGAINADQQDFLKTVDENIDRLTEMISNMLDISKIESGRLRLNRKRLDIRQLLETTIASYKTLTGQRTLDIQLAKVVPVFADSNRILQILGNLFSNGVKFTKPDGTLTFSAEERDGFVAVSVSDNGVGISPDDVPNLFQKFSQVGEGQSKPQSSGLGLMLCKELVGLHKGTISVASELGRGSTFTFTLPVYTPRFAMEEHFEELLQAARSSDQDTMALLAIEATPLLGQLSQAQADQRTWHLDQAADVVRKHVHRGDAVLAVEPHWIVIIAMTDLAGAQAMEQRLRMVLSDWAKTTLIGCSDLVSLRFGTAFSPIEGADVHSLFVKATTSLREEPSAPPPSTETRS